jgi:hypothetical protein
MITEQHELYEYARERIGQKKRLFSHFITFIIGSLFLFAANIWIKIGEPTLWYIWAITVWLFIFILHFIKVIVTDRFMNKNWERLQIDKLMAIQEKKIAELKNDIENSNL